MSDHIPNEISSKTGDQVKKEREILHAALLKIRSDESMRQWCIEKAIACPQVTTGSLIITAEKIRQFVLEGIPSQNPATPQSV